MNTASLHYLQTSLSRIDDLIRAAVSRTQEIGQNPGDALRGLVVSWDEIEGHLDTQPLQGLWDGDKDILLSLDPEHGKAPDVPFLKMVKEFDLSILDAFIFLLCFAPELDRRYERIYGFLQDDVSQKRATVNLLMNLLGGTLEQRFGVWERLKPHHPLIDNRLLMTFSTNEKPAGAAGLSGQVRVDSRVVSHLLGEGHPDPRLRPMLLPPPSDQSVALDVEAYDALCHQIHTAPIIFMKGRSGLGQASTAAALSAALGLPLLRFDLSKFSQTPGLTFEEAWRLALREARLRGSVLMIEQWDALLDENNADPDRDFWQAIYTYPRLVILCGKKDWEPQDIERTRRMLRVAFDLPSYPDRLNAWREFVDRAEIQFDDDVLKDVSNKFRLPRDQIARSVISAIDIAASRYRDVQTEDVYAGIQAHISLQLGQLADRIIPKFTWSDLVLPPDEMSQLVEITQRARHAYKVQHTWGFKNRIPNANGVSALFSGESGTGKTLSVQVIANELGLSLYRIDLSAVVSKYIGETEKNLNRIFTEARMSNAILFFDEADAIFGKRSEVKDARDRYANIEIAYLLQQIEDYDGIAIMATNLRQNLDEAFTRRIDFMIDFPFPDAAYRYQIWKAHFPPDAPLSPDVDLEQIAEQYYLAGGNIRNAALASAFFAANDEGIITLDHIRRAIRRENQKMGRLMEEF